MKHEEVRDALLSKRWKRTTTFKTYPHAYSLEREWEDKELFRKVWRFIRKNGEARVFYRRVYRYYEIDGWEYWAMFTHDNEGIINRAEYKNVSNSKEDNI